MPSATHVVRIREDVVARLDKHAPPGDRCRSQYVRKAIEMMLRQPAARFADLGRRQHGEHCYRSLALKLDRDKLQMLCQRHPLYTANVLVERAVICMLDADEATAEAAS